MSYTTKLCSPEDLRDSDILAWLELESRSSEPNAYLSPHFIFPAIKHLERTKKIYLLMIYRTSKSGPSLVGLFIFTYSKFGKFFPLPHIAAFHSRHTFVSGILSDKEFTEEVVQIIFDGLNNLPFSWHGLLLEDHPAEGRLVEFEMQLAAQAGMSWVMIAQWERSILKPSGLGQNAINDLPKKLRKNYRRREQGLSKLGTLDWKLVKGNELTIDHIEKFMKLENMGWKGKNGSSLLSRSDYAAFFQEMILNFNGEERAFMTEITLNGEVIASTANLISGDAGFAFKTGWDLSYTRYSPGILNRLTLLECQDPTFRKLAFFDSGASKDSYINSIWPEKRRMHSGIFVRSTIGKGIIPLLQFGFYPAANKVKDIKRKWRGH